MSVEVVWGLALCKNRWGQRGTKGHQVWGPPRQTLGGVRDLLTCWGSGRSELGGNCGQGGESGFYPEGSGEPW